MSLPEETVARIAGLTKTYQDRQVLHGVDVTLEAGRSYFLVGPNGCGKTTTIETLIGLRTPGGGKVELLGMTPPDTRLRPRIRVCLQGAALHAQVTVREHFAFLASLYGTSAAQTELIAEQFGITDLLGRRFGRLSGGQQKRVMVAGALFGEADVIILDEPTSGVDLESRLSLWASFREAIAGRDTTLLATTHDLNEAEDYADEVIVMRDGKVRAHGAVSALISDSGLVAVVPVPTESAEAIRAEAPEEDRHLLSKDRGTTTFGYTSRQAVNADLRRLEAREVLVRERSARLTDAYLFTYRGVST